jgi:pimeloyl-ACP methyl ester carboxylesterase
VLRLAQFQVLSAIFVSFLLAAPLHAAVDSVVAGHIPENPSYILVGFVGGFVSHDNPNHGPVQFAQHMRRTVPQDTYVQVFENRHRKTAFQTIVRLLDRDHDGTLTDEEKSRARIILFGQSWGAAAAVLLARDLDRAGIPVLLTVQVDSVAKFWQDDSIIPSNVAAAANFYQPHGIVHGRREIKAADPSHTQILGNYRFDYKKAPVHCDGVAWYDRVFTPGHMQSECDPHLWQQVGDLVMQRIAPQPSAVAANPQP